MAETRLLGTSLRLTERGRGGGQGSDGGPEGVDGPPGSKLIDEVGYCAGGRLFLLLRRLKGKKQPEVGEDIAESRHTPYKDTNFPESLYETKQKGKKENFPFRNTHHLDDHDLSSRGLLRPLHLDDLHLLLLRQGQGHSADLLPRLRLPCKKDASQSEASCPSRRAIHPFFSPEIRTNDILCMNIFFSNKTFFFVAPEVRQYGIFFMKFLERIL